jgi:hypothetical protein
MSRKVDEMKTRTVVQGPGIRERGRVGHARAKVLAQTLRKEYSRAEAEKQPLPNPSPKRRGAKTSGS